MKEPIAIIPYDQMQFRWIAMHWDIHYNGICTYNNQLCEFQTIEGDGRWTGDDEDKEEEWVETIPTVCKIYHLTPKEKLIWLHRQTMFEWFVGYHWTYPYRKTGQRQFRYRKPVWLYKLLFKLYYCKQMKKIKK